MKKFAVFLFALALFLLPGCPQNNDCVPKERFTQIEDAYLETLANYNAQRALTANLTGEISSLRDFNSNLADSFAYSQDQLLYHKNLSVGVKNRLEKAERALDALEFSTQNVFSRSEPTLPDVVDTTSMISQLNDSVVARAWQSYLECGECSEKDILGLKVQSELIKLASFNVAQANADLAPIYNT